jgi:hypothetical protein
VSFLLSIELQGSPKGEIPVADVAVDKVCEGSPVFFTMVTLSVNWLASLPTTEVGKIEKECT